MHTHTHTVYTFYDVRSYVYVRLELSGIQAVNIYKYGGK